MHVKRLVEPVGHLFVPGGEITVQVLLMMKTHQHCTSDVLVRRRTVYGSRHGPHENHPLKDS